MTPPRTGDAARVAELLSDPRIHLQLVSPPVPYRLEHAIDWLARIIPERGIVSTEIDEAGDEVESKILSGCPFQFLREVREDGSEELIGSIDLMPYPETHAYKLDSLVGVWTIGDWLAPSHHRRGIMTDAVRTIIYDWAVPRLNAQRIIVGAFTDNTASIGVFLKIGFKSVEVDGDNIMVRGVMKGIHTLELDLRRQEQVEGE